MVSFLLRVKGYKVFLSNVIFSLLPGPNSVHSQQEQGHSHRAGILLRGRGGRWRIQIFTPHPSRIRFLKGGELHSLAKAPGGSVSHLPLPLSPGRTQAQAYMCVRACVCVCVYALTHKLTHPQSTMDPKQVQGQWIKPFL